MKIGMLVVAGVTATTLVAGSPAASAAPSGPVPAPLPASAVASGGKTVTNEGSSTAAAVCVFQTAGDYVHVSSSAFEASGHGWWINGNCSATTAVVTVQLQQFYSDGRWRNQGSAGRATVRSGGGAGNRATGRAGCTNSSVTGWRSVIDVDLVGLADDPTKLTTSARDIACRR